MARSDSLHAWARKGAAARLEELAGERTAIFREFPQLRRQGGARAGGTQAPAEEESSPAPTRRRRNGMSPAQRKAVGERMRRYWAARRAAGQQDAQQPATDEGPTAEVIIPTKAPTPKRRGSAGTRATASGKPKWGGGRRAGQKRVRG